MTVHSDSFGTEHEANLYAEEVRAKGYRARVSVKRTGRCWVFYWWPAGGAK